MGRFSIRVPSHAAAAPGFLGGMLEQVIPAIEKGRQRALELEDEKRATDRRDFEYDRNKKDEAARDERERTQQIEAETRATQRQLDQERRSQELQGIVTEARLDPAGPSGGAMGGIPLPRFERDYDPKRDLLAERTRSIETQSRNPWELAGHKYDSEEEFFKAYGRQQQLQDRYNSSGRLTAGQALTERARQIEAVEAEASGLATLMAGHGVPADVITQSLSTKYKGVLPLGRVAGLSYGSSATVEKTEKTLGDVEGLSMDQQRGFRGKLDRARQIARSRGEDPPTRAEQMEWLRSQKLTDAQIRAIINLPPQK